MSHSLGPVFIVFEGLDGSGKTTCARRVAEALGAEFMQTPSGLLRRYRDDLVASFDGCQEAAQHLYQASVFATSRRVRGLLEQGRSVVLDRYFLSTEAYAAFRGSSIQHDDQCASLTPAHLTVFLHAPLTVRRARIQSRGMITDADKETLSESADARLRLEHMARAGLPVVGAFLALDTSLFGPNEAADRVTSMCRQLASFRAHPSELFPLSARGTPAESS